MHKHHRRAQAWFINASACLLAVALPVCAATDEVRTIDIPSLALDEALLAVSRAFDVNVIASEELTSGVLSGSLSGEFSVERALTRLLSGTELVFQRGDNGTYILSESPKDNRDEEGAATRNDVIEQVIVYGTKQYLSLQETSTSVALYDMEELETQVMRELGDVIIRTPNVSTGGGGPRAIAELSLRGIRIAGVGNAGTGATSNVYMDGSPMSAGAQTGATNMWDIAQVEILRGPQSTIQGRNALAGAIVIRTADPEYDFGARVRALAGSEETQQLSAMVTGPIVEGQAAFRLSADSREFDYGYRNAFTGDTAIDQDSTTLRGKVLIEPEAMDSLRLMLSAQFIDTEYGDANLVGAPVPITDPAFRDFDPFAGISHRASPSNAEVDVTRYALDLSFDLSENWSLTSLVTYEGFNLADEFLGLGEVDSEDTTYQLELRANFDYGRLRGWVGAYYFDQEELVGFKGGFVITDLFGLPTDPAGSEAVVTDFADTTTENKALFADFTYDLSDRWQINIGARYDREEFVTVRQTTNSVSPAECTFPFLGDLPCVAFFPPPTEEPPTAATFSAFLPRASITYRFSDDQSLTLGAQRGYRAGGSYVRNDGESLMLTTDEFDPEFLTNFELAYRSEWQDGRLVFNANLFYSDWEDQQVTVPGDNPGLIFNNFTLNAGESELYGLELFSSFQVTPELRLFASAGLLSTEFTDFPFAAGSGTRFENLAGNAFNTAPERSAALGIDHTHRSGIFTSWNLAYTGKQYSDVTNLPINEVDAFTLLNGKIGYRNDGFEIYAFGTNITGEDYFVNQNLESVDSLSGLPSPNDNPTFTVGDPRVLGVAVTWEI